MTRTQFTLLSREKRKMEKYSFRMLSSIQYRYLFVVLKSNNMGSISTSKCYKLFRPVVLSFANSFKHIRVVAFHLTSNMLIIQTKNIPLRRCTKIAVTLLEDLRTLTRHGSTYSARKNDHEDHIVMMMQILSVVNQRGQSLTGRKKHRNKNVSHFM